MASWAKPGVKCVCIRKSRWISGATMLPTEYGPKFEEVLTIAVVVDHEVYGPGLHFVEYSEDLEGNPPVYPVREFRPLIDRDISLFAHHLETEKADA